MQNSILSRLVIEQIPIAQIVPDPRNPRRHSNLQIGQLARSIDTFGFNVPILVDAANKVIAGHGRLLACKQLGWEEIPVIRLAHLSEAQARTFAIADNRLTEVSLWDDQLLAEVFRDLATLDLDFSLEVTGFSIGEIDLRIESLTSRSEKADPDDALPAPGPTVTRSGDLWLLGKHRLFCGDALAKDSYRLLMAERLGHVAFTDPPYNVPIDGHATGNGRIHHRDFQMASGGMTSGQFTNFLSNALHLLAQHTRSGAIHYISMDWRHQAELLTAGAQVYSELKNLCVWVKDNAGMGSLYRSQHELVFVFKYGRSTHRNNVQLGKFGRNRSNVWRYPGANDFGRVGEEGNLLALHPTVKPVALVADAILDCSSRGDIVVDPFLGSGSTLMAAERTGRICCAMEIDPSYIDTAIRRWQRMTGEQAHHALTGSAFDDVLTPPEERKNG